MRNSARSVDDDYLTYRLRGLDEHITHIMVVDRDDPDQIAAFRDAVRLAVGITKKNGPITLKVERSVFRVRRARYVLAALAVLVLVLGAISRAERAESSNSFAPPTAHFVTPSEDHANAMPESQVASPSNSEFFWRGRVRITAEGVNFDSAPPSGAGDGGIYFKGQGVAVLGTSIYGVGGVLLSTTQSSQNLGKKDCVEAINAAALFVIPLQGAAGGTGYCFRTLRGRVGTMRLISAETTSDSSVEVLAAVWN